MAKTDLEAVKDKIYEAFWPIEDLAQYLTLTHEKIDDPCGHLGTILLALKKQAQKEIEKILDELEAKESQQASD